MLVKHIFVPAGKELHDIRGLYKYVGPTTVRHHRGLRLGPTYTDGTSWEYIEDKKHRESQEEAAKKEVEEKASKKVEPLALESEKVEEVEVEAPKKKRRKKKVESPEETSE
jgi:hypothetical protein